MFIKLDSFPREGMDFYSIMGLILLCEQKTVGLHKNKAIDSKAQGLGDNKIEPNVGQTNFKSRLPLNRYLY